MEPLTTIKKMLSETKISVPPYQRAYSWETPTKESERKTHTDVFFNDIEEYRKNNSNSPYYFGHFLFEEKNCNYFVIDGQQRITTIIILLSSIFFLLKKKRKLTEDEEIYYEDTIKRKGKVKFFTVDYDNSVFTDCIINNNEIFESAIKTDSQRRILNAYNYFIKELKIKSDTDLSKIIRLICESKCTTHIVRNEAEANQMFIFQNNRGKKPSNLEIVKANFMYNILLHDKDNKENSISEIKDRFEEIYKSISSIDYKINEDDILLYTARVHFNSLKENNATDKINKSLREENKVDFILNFTKLLSYSFIYLNKFFNEHEKKYLQIHSLISLGGYSVAMPFIIKAYKCNLEINDILDLCELLESIIIRHRIIGTRADISSRLEKEFQNFLEDDKKLYGIRERINFLKTTDAWWYDHWNDEYFRNSLQGDIEHSLAKFLLWKYELYLQQKNASSYEYRRFDKIAKKLELEHIAPQTEPDSNNHGYGKYTDDFVNNYINCIGNYLLISKADNCSISNSPFSKKYEKYTAIEQQKEIQDMVSKNGPWNKQAIKKRKEKIISVILKLF